jgi:electron transfer flavoprotein beta subunit
MQIFVCIKQALDWNASTKDFRIDPKTHEVAVSFARYRIDQFDEIALEVGLQYRDKLGGELRALTVGSEDADDVLRHAFAMKADQGTLIERTESATSTPAILAAAVRHYGGGIVLCGRTSSGSGTGQTGPAMAEILGLPFVANVVHIEGQENEWLCRCETAHGYEVLKVTKPFVATITNAETNLPRVPSMKDVMRAHRTKLDSVNAESLGAATAAPYAQRTRVLRRYIPTTSRACKRIGGGPKEQAKALAQYIRTLSTRV